MTIKSEIEKFWSEMNSARRKPNFARLGAQIEATMDVLYGVLGKSEMNKLEEKMDEFEKKHRKAYLKIDNDTKDYPLLDRDPIRNGRRGRQDVWLLREKYKAITNLITDKDLVDLK